MEENDKPCGRFIVILLIVALLFFGGFKAKDLYSDSMREQYETGFNEGIENGKTLGYKTGYKKGVEDTKKDILGKLAVYIPTYDVEKTSKFSSIGYDKRTNTLVVVGSSGLKWAYYDVPSLIYENMFNCDSIDEYFNKRIEPYFNYKLIS